MQDQKEKSGAEEQENRPNRWSWERWLLVSVALALVGVAAGYLIAYASHPNWVKPGDLAIPTILWVGLGALFMLVTPWQELGYFPRKFFGVEFGEAMAAQSKERIVQIDKLRKDFEKKVDNLRAEMTQLRPQGGSATVDAPAEPGAPTQAVTAETDQRKTQLSKLLDKFFRKYVGTFFDVEGIERKSSETPDFDELTNYKSKEIEQSIYDLIADKKLDTQVSRTTGNTLYGRKKKRRD